MNKITAFIDANVRVTNLKLNVMTIKTVNLSEMNLDDLPKGKSVYVICAQSIADLKPIAYRYVGMTDNLEKTIKAHFNPSERNECLREFMLSTKVIMMKYELLPDSNKTERLEKEKEWIDTFLPDCNK